jgi:hypothetical protein
VTSSPLSTRVDNEKRVAVCACSRLASSGLDRLGLPPAGGCQERRSGQWPFHSARSREGSGECLGGDIVGQRSVANGQADAVDKSQEQSVIAGAEFERHILQNDRSSESGQGGKNLFGGYNID